MSKSSPPRSSIAANLRRDSAEAGPPPAIRRSSWRRGLRIGLVRWALWLHIYISMFGLAAVLFFSVTGITLNHPDWFASGEPVSDEAEGDLAREWLRPTSAADATAGADASVSAATEAGPDKTAPGPRIEGAGQVARLEIVEHFRKAHGARGAVTDFRVDESECSVSFRGAGYAADAFIDRETGHYRLSQTRHGWVAVINDLHKGRDTGPVWSVVIDVSAVVLSIIALTGFLLLFFLRLRRKPGLVVGVLGTIALLAVGWYWVP